MARHGSVFGTQCRHKWARVAVESGTAFAGVYRIASVTETLSTKIWNEKVEKF